MITCSSSEDDSGSSPQGPLLAETRLNVSYGENSQQVYDLYLPAGRSAETTKVIVIIHGGGWTSGDKSDMNPMVSLLQTLHPNHAIVNVNYVLADSNHTAFPNQFQDLRTIIQKITNEKNELQLNPQFGLIGASAGAHIAMMYETVYDQLDQVKFVADIVGPTDFTDPFFDQNIYLGQYLELLVDETAYPSDTNFILELSPFSHVSSTTSPMCMFYGDEDPLVPEENGVSMQQKLNQYNTPNELRIFNGGHGDNWSQTDVVEMQSIINSYIHTYLE